MSAVRKPAHGGYPDAKASLPRRSIVLQIAAADREHRIQSADWQAIRAGEVDIGKLLDVLDYAARCAGWQPLGALARYRILAVAKATEPTPC